MVSKRLQEFLDKEGIRYKALKHSQAFTAQEIAASAHISGWKMAKTVLVTDGGKMMMVVLPAPALVDIASLREATSAKRLRLADEEEFQGLFPDCELGAMPPFGNLYGLPVYVDESLRQDDNIAFNAGTHRDLIRMSYADFERLVEPKHLRCAVQVG